MELLAEGVSYDRPTFPNKTCEHKVAEHIHGTHACYVLDRCRCDDCRAATRRYENHRSKWAREFPYIEPPLIDAQPVRRRVKRLIDAGMGLKRIAEVSGVPHGAISKLIYGDYVTGRKPSRRVRRETAERLLGCPYDLGDGAKVDATEAKAIVTELVARGWAKRSIARRIGDNPNAGGLQSVNSPLVMAGTLRSLRLLLDEPVPLRRHGPTGKMYQPKTDHEWHHIPPSTPGVPGEDAPASELPEFVGKGELRCDICGEPLAGHGIGIHQLGRMARL